ncbi:MAG: hypothetical protein IIY73_03155, partial [Solobacterium sp.]|nr:hypothetical protein [Solobacterium sp.]
PLLAEANYECPLCHKKLVETIKNQPIKKYRITQIFPDGLDEDTAALFDTAYKAPSRLDTPENLIALDEDGQKAALRWLYPAGLLPYAQELLDEGRYCALP